jgi:single-stranded-DNA-specific exonuclease
MGSALPSFRLLVETNEAAAEAIADEVEALQIARRAAQETMVEEAEADILNGGYLDAPAIVLGRPSWNIGIVGIVAGKLAERYQRPVVVYGADAELGRGSVRGPAGVSLYELLAASAHTLVRFGGHEAAAGFEVELTRVSEFREAFITAMTKLEGNALADGAKSSNNSVLLLAAGDDPLLVARDLRRLEPCGAGNPAPTLGVVGKLTQAREVRGGHLRLEMTLDGGHRVTGFAPGLGALASTLSPSVLLVGSLRISSYGGRERAEILVSSVVPWELRPAAHCASSAVDTGEA